MERTEQSGPVGVGALEEALAKLAPRAWAATEDDAVAGVMPRAVVEPETEEEVAAVLRYASSEGLAIIPRGGGTQLDYGAPPRRADIILSMARISGVIEHAPHDLTVTVRAGTPLAELQNALGEARQWLAIDAPLAPGATIGGIIATNATGPRRQRYGGVRDQIIGVRVALADGTIARGGGKVVKNVAGYDLPKLFTSALGTLGVVLSASFRLYPIPPHSGSALVEAPELEPLCALALSVMAQPVVPTILDLFPPAEPGSAHILAVRFESAVAEAITDQIAAVQRLAEAAGLSANGTREEDDAVWWRERDDWMAALFAGEGGVVLKASVLPSDVSTWLAALEAARAGFAGLTDLRWRAHAGLGLITTRLAGPADAIAGWGAVIERLRGAAVERRGSLVVTHTPPALRGHVDPWGPANGLEIMRGLKARFDPTDALNPGRFVGGL
jgi:glycolate dehydrogenase FAD-binding subunit